jgi:hypothetical protein
MDERLLRFMQHLPEALEPKQAHLSSERMTNLAKTATEREPRRRIAQPADDEPGRDSSPTVRQPPKEGRPNPPAALDRWSAVPHETKRAI